MLQNYITGSYYGIILRNHLCEKDPGDARDVPGAPWDSGDSLGTALRPVGTPLGHLGTPLGRSGTPLGTPGTPLRRPRDAPGTPRNLQGPLTDHRNGHISENIQRQKLSITALEAACWYPSHEALDRAFFCIKRPPKSKNYPSVPGFR